jgi:hypothetical protein
MSSEMTDNPTDGSDRKQAGDIVMDPSFTVSGFQEKSSLASSNLQISRLCQKTYNLPKSRAVKTRMTKI